MFILLHHLKFWTRPGVPSGEGLSVTIDEAVASSSLTRQHTDALLGSCHLQPSRPWCWPTQGRERNFLPPGYGEAFHLVPRASARLSGAPVDDLHGRGSSQAWPHSGGITSPLMSKTSVAGHLLPQEQTNLFRKQYPEPSLLALVLFALFHHFLFASACASREQTYCTFARALGLLLEAC